MDQDFLDIGHLADQFEVKIKKHAQGRKHASFRLLRQNVSNGDFSLIGVEVSQTNVCFYILITFLVKIFALWQVENDSVAVRSFT